MLKGGCINPEIMKALSLCGHGDQILIADGNYPLAAETGAAEKVYLGLAAGVPEVTQVLETLLREVNFERAQVMLPDEGGAPEIFADFTRLLGGMKLDGLDRRAFYEACRQPKVRLAVSTGEKRVFANILLTVGVA